MSFFPVELIIQATALLETCQREGVKIAIAESCTGGLICALLTEIPGASKVVECGFVTYSTVAKIRILGVSTNLLLANNAVNESVAQAMAEGTLYNCPEATLALGVTGIAGPDGGSHEQPVGSIYLAAVQRKASAFNQKFLFIGNRTEIRLATIAAALTMLQALVALSSEREDCSKAVLL